MIQCNDDQTPMNVPPQGKAECPLCGKFWELNEDRTAVKSVTIEVRNISTVATGNAQKGATKEIK